MSSSKVLKFGIYSIWLLVGVGIVAEYIAYTKLSTDILILTAQNTCRPFAWVIFGVFLALFALTSNALLQRKPNGRALLIASTALLPLYALCAGTHVTYAWISLFHDVIPLILGALIGCLFTEATTRNIRLLCVSIFIATICTIISAYYTDEAIPALFAEYVELNSTESLGLDLLGLFSFVAMPVSLIFLFFRIDIAKYLFALAILGALIVDVPAFDALTGLDAFTGKIELILTGVLLGVLYKK